MTRKERVIAAIQFESVDRIPYSFYLNGDAYQRLVDFTGDAGILNRVHNHITSADFSKPHRVVKPDFTQDEYGVIWNKSGVDKEIGVVDNIQIQTMEDLEKYQFPEVDEAYIRSQMQWLQDFPEDTFKLASLGFCLFERAWTLMGMENLLCCMLTEPELVHTLLDRICARNLAILDIALSYSIDGVYFGDDWGQQSGLIMGAPLWRTFLKPRVAKMYDRVKSHGKFVFQHSCGDLRDIMMDLDEIGLDVYQTFQPEIYGLSYAQTMYGKIAVWGGLSTQMDLPFRSPEEIRQLVRDLCHAFRRGGLILAPTHSVPGDVPPENILAMWEEFERSVPEFPG